jgi:hypothetical protein
MAMMTTTMMMTIQGPVDRSHLVTEIEIKNKAFRFDRVRGLPEDPKKKKEEESFFVFLVRSVFFLSISKKRTVSGFRVVYDRRKNTFGSSPSIRSIRRDFDRPP